MSTHGQLSQSRLGLLSVAAMVLGADLILLCWRVAEGQPVGIPALGGGAMLCASHSVLLAAQRRKRVVEGYRRRSI
jgi:hypothetical protein